MIGVVTQRLGEGYRVDIGEAHQASLDGLAFEGATKRNKPNLKVRTSLGILLDFSTNIYRSDVWCTQECLSLTRTWNPSLNASMLRHIRLKGLANLKMVFSLGVA